MPRKIKPRPVVTLATFCAVHGITLRWKKDSQGLFSVWTDEVSIYNSVDPVTGDPSTTEIVGHGDSLLHAKCDFANHISEQRLIIDTPQNFTEYKACAPIVR